MKTVFGGWQTMLVFTKFQVSHILNKNAEELGDIR